MRRRQPGRLRPDGVEAVLVHSPEAGRRLAGAAVGNALFACISEAAAAPVREAGAARVAVAPRPDEAALLALLG
jgi:uroporphyrinogen-III synthase